MALTLDATVGGSSANSYSTLAAANSYHDGRLHKAVWTDALDAEKDSALVWATRLIDAHTDWYGSKQTIDQSLRWPRYGASGRDGYYIPINTVPSAVQNAVAELARLLISSDRTIDADTLGFDAIKVGPISIGVDALNQKDIIPESVFMLVSHLGTRIGGGGVVVQLGRS